jgi:hypothetical protein
MNNSLFRVIAAALMMGAVSSGRSDDQKDNAYLWKPKVSSVTVFKNGLGFFLRQGKVALRDGWCVADAVPPASFGTLAVYSHGQDETVDIIGAGPGETVAFDGVDAPADAATKRVRLEACKFLKVQLAYRQQGAERTAAGQLVSVSPEYVVLQSENNSFAVPLEGIYKLQVLEKPLRVHVAADAGKAPAETTLGMAYLRKGITWIPEYTLKITGEDTAELTLRGTLVNEAEDLVHCDVNFVVGVPHFFHTDYLAPVAVGQIIRTIGAAVAPREVMSQMMNAAAIPRDTGSALPGVLDRPVPTGGRDLKDAAGNLPQWEGVGSADFTVYTRKDLTVRQGEKAIVTLFVKKITFGHIYRWTPPGEIKHFLVLKNSTDSSWTTGPCLAISDGHPLSEDLLHYVPKGGVGEFPVTTAIDLAQSQKEGESKRDLKAHQPSSNYYLDLVGLDGLLTLQNYGKRAADVVVELPITGKPTVASDDGRIQLSTTNLKLTERTGSIQWRVSVNPGELRKLTYSYERYVPSN